MRWMREEKNGMDGGDRVNEVDERGETEGARGIMRGEGDEEGTAIILM